MLNSRFGINGFGQWREFLENRRMAPYPGGLSNADNHYLPRL